MWEPVGPLPAAVYWRRRFVAIASTVAVLIVLAWSFASLLGPSGPTTTNHAAERAAQTAPQQSAPSPVPGAPGTGQGGFVVPALPADPTAGEPGADAPADVPATTSEVLVPDDTPRAPVPVPPSVPVPPTGPVPCTNGMLSVLAEIDSPEHRVGERPTLRLVVTNVSEQACVRDLDAARQEIVVWSGDGSDRLWSSNDCVNASTEDLRTLVPGQPVAFSVRWVGRTSVPGCAAERTTVPPGAYRVMTRVDDLISAPTPFLRSP